MSTQPVKWVGTASINLLSGTDLPVNTPISVDIDPNKIKVDWAGNAPVVRENDFLGSTFPNGYQVSYQVDYYLAGYIYIDSGSAEFIEHTTDFFTGEVQSPNILRPTQGAGFWYYWQYGTDGGGVRYTVPVGSVPSRIDYRIQRSGVKYIGRQITWTVAYTITVVQSCTLADITADICRDVCLGNPTQECYLNYNEYCLKGDPSRLAQPTCKDFFTKWININGSDEQIDAQARRYCSAKYNGFADLLEGSKTVPDQERLADIDICACNLQAKPGPDPSGTVLYTNYFNSLSAQFPGFGVYGASIQQKCLVPQCASSSFKPAGVGVGGCSVPQCLNLISITNDGTVTGDIIATASCQSTAAGDGGLSIIAVVIIVLIVLLVLYLISWFMMSSDPVRPKPRYEANRQPSSPTSISRS